MSQVVIPRGELGTANITANITTTSTTPVDATGLSVTVTTGTRPVIVSLNALVSHSVADNQVQVNILEDGVQILQSNLYSPTSGGFVPISPFVRRNPAAGSHTYKIQWFVVNAGTGTIGAGANFPATVEVVEV